LGLIATQGAAQDQTCTLQDQACVTDCATMTVSFEIDRAQFVAPVDPNDPPRRQVTFVTMDNQSFSATAILFPGGVSGFHEDAGELGSRLMIIQPDGSARLALLPSHQTWVGSCTAQ
jgi:hypothetical protein